MTGWKAGKTPVSHILCCLLNPSLKPLFNWCGETWITPYRLEAPPATKIYTERRRDSRLSKGGVCTYKSYGCNPKLYMGEGGSKNARLTVQIIVYGVGVGW